LPFAGRRERRRVRHAHRPTPFVEGIEDVGIAEINPHGPASRPFAVVAFEVPIDARVRHLEWNPLGGPRGDQIEGRPRHSDQVSVVLLTEVSFNLRTELPDVQASFLQFCNPAILQFHARVWFLSQMILRPWSVMSGSIAAKTFVSGTMSGA